MFQKLSVSKAMCFGVSEVFRKLGSLRAKHLNRAGDGPKETRFKSLMFLRQDVLERNRNVPKERCLK